MMALCHGAGERVNIRVATNGPQAPASAPERILLLDALRGFALLGVLLVHANHMAANVSAPNLECGLLINSALDLWANRFVEIFVSEKAQTVFTVLFGISFIIQFERLERRLADPGSVYRRRLFGLLVIGLLHVLLLPAADILIYFSLGGFVLLIVRRWETSSLAGLGILLALAVMPTAYLLGAIGPPSPDSDTLGNLNLPAPYQYGSYLEIMQRHWHNIWFVDHLARGLLTLQLYVLGRLMLGIVVIRSGLLTEPGLHRRALRCGAVTGLLAGVLLTESLWMERWAERMGWVGNPASWEALALYFRQAGTLLLAAGYAALFALAWQNTLWRRLLSTFAPMGQLAVTNYLLQSVFISLLFYGFGLGLLGRLGATWCVLLALAVFSLQCLLSYAWLRRFQFGPVEWLWRCWTYSQRPAWSRVQLPPMA